MTECTSGGRIPSSGGAEECPSRGPGILVTDDGFVTSLSAEEFIICPRFSSKGSRDI